MMFHSSEPESKARGSVSRRPPPARDSDTVPLTRTRPGPTGSLRVIDYYAAATESDGAGGRRLNVTGTVDDS
jgi:hypothetical protein